MNIFLSNINQWHKTRLGYLIFGLVELGLAYVFASLAVNSGSLWQWLIAIILLVGFFQNFVKLIGKIIHECRRQTN